MISAGVVMVGDGALVELDDCWICKTKVDGESAAIGRGGDLLSYIPFVEDLRSSAVRVAHPVCFAAENGVEQLVALVHEHDYRERRRWSS